jgi:predicted GTPase
MDTASFSDAWGGSCLCYVVDSTERDTGKIQEARARLQALAASQPGKPIIVVLSKRDVEAGMNRAEVAREFALEELAEGRFLQVLEVSVLTNSGLDELSDSLKAAAAEWSER